MLKREGGRARAREKRRDARVVCVFVCECAYGCVCVYVYVRVKVYVCVCAYVCVRVWVGECVNEREIER